ncbi:DNA mismatch repair protein MutS [Maritimibacter sp. DP07]|uniref:DNA mismatch repair protein MutS n=2 Tax=Maritimibacter harenae TaxID=2606218 RepID=A0A845M7D6_9RHOB|nr:DNA mismatch repair protein MutS [Maritimibacter harenae]
MRPERPQTAQEAIAPKPAPDRAKIDRFDLGERAQTRLPDHSIAPKIEEEIARAPVSMDRKRFMQMKRGKMRPEARIDLHGLTLAHAHPVLMRFILESVAEGRRLVLVITGKGRTRQNDGPIPERHGVLRHQVPHWLHTPPLKAHVLQISEAHVKHGGLGAYYVYLRRAR